MSKRMQEEDQHACRRVRYSHTWLLLRHGRTAGSIPQHQRAAGRSIVCWLVFIACFGTGSPVHAQGKRGGPTNKVKALALQVDGGIAQKLLSKARAYLLPELNAGHGPREATSLLQADDRGVLAVSVPDGQRRMLILDTLPALDEKIDLASLRIPAMTAVGAVRSDYGKLISATARSLDSFSDAEQAIDELDVLLDAIDRSPNPKELDELRARIKRVQSELEKIRNVPRSGVATEMATGGTRITVNLVPVIPGELKNLLNPKVNQALAGIGRALMKPAQDVPGAPPAENVPGTPPTENRGLEPVPRASYGVRSCYILDSIGRPVVGPEGKFNRAKASLELELFPGSFYNVIIVPTEPLDSELGSVAPLPVLISLCPSGPEPPTAKPPVPYDEKLLIDCPLQSDLTKEERGKRLGRIGRLVRKGMEYGSEEDRRMLQGLLDHLVMLADENQNGLVLDPEEAPRRMACLIHLVKAGPAVDNAWTLLLAEARQNWQTEFWAVCDTTNPDLFGPFFRGKPENMRVLGHVNLAVEVTPQMQIARARTASQFNADGIFIDNFSRQASQSLGVFLKQNRVVVVGRAAGHFDEEDVKCEWIDHLVAGAIDETSYQRVGGMAERQRLKLGTDAALPSRVKLGIFDRSLLNPDDAGPVFRRAVESRCEVVCLTMAGVAVPNGLPVAADQVLPPPDLFWKSYMGLLREHNQKCFEFEKNMKEIGRPRP